MSDSRSTPTTSPITSTSKIPPSLDISSSPSRTQIYETKDSQGSSTTPRTRTLSLKHNIHSPNNHRRPAEGNSPDHRPTKKMRRHHSEERSEGHSSPSNSSHSGIGDHEERSQLSEASSAPTTFEFAPAKKKRTRTLTTPHQAAILHSLLAQSPFPTTAVREDVGRQIGLSARKVQIWFQNQRQKARRPPPQNSQNVPNRYPVYGSHAHYAPPAQDDYYGVPNDPALKQLAESRSSSEHPWTSGQRRRGLDGRFLPPEETPAPGFRLAGPGMPGSSQQSRQTSVERHSPSNYHSHTPSYPPTASLSYSPQFRHHIPPRRHSQSPPRMRESDTKGSSSYIPATASGGSGDPTFSRTLPPIDFNSHRPYGSVSPTNPSNYYATRSAPSVFDIPKRTSSSSSRPHSPDLRSPKPSIHSHWDSPSPWSRPSTRGESPVVMRHQDAPPPRPNPISRRFDPVYDSVSVNEARGYSPPASSTSTDHLPNAHHDATQ